MAQGKPRSASRTAARGALRRKVTNVVVMVPDTDWARVLTGEKRMFRSYSRRPQNGLLPTPAVAYRFGAGERVETAPIWLEDTWQEPLGSISPEHVAEEGFADLASFRRYFAERYPNGGFRPLATVQVYRVRPLTDEDRESYAERLLKHLGYA